MICLYYQNYLSFYNFSKETIDNLTIVVAFVENSKCMKTDELVIGIQRHQPQVDNFEEEDRGKKSEEDSKKVDFELDSYSFDEQTCYSYWEVEDSSNFVVDCTLHYYYAEDLL